MLTCATSGERMAQNAALSVLLVLSQHPLACQIFCDSTSNSHPHTHTHPMPIIDPRPFIKAEFESLEANPDKDIAELTLTLRKETNPEPLPGLGLTTPRRTSGKRPLLRSDGSSDEEDGLESGYDSESGDEGVKSTERHPGDPVKKRGYAAPSKRAFTVADLTNRHLVDRLPTLFASPDPRERRTAPLPILAPRFEVATHQKPAMENVDESSPANDRGTVLPSSLKDATAKGIGSVDERDEVTFRLGRHSAEYPLHDRPRSQTMGHGSFDAIDSVADSLNAAVRGLVMAEDHRLVDDAVYTHVTDLSIDSMSQVSIAVRIAKVGYILYTRILL